MKPSVYVIGGAGTGKSTFTAQLLDNLGAVMGPLQDLHAMPNARGTIVTLRGHHLHDNGLYIGCMRDEFPGTDGLDRASSITGEDWLVRGGAEGFSYIVSEGATLATRRFLNSLHEHTNLLLVWLVADDFVKELRFLERGSSQDSQFVTATTTRSANLARDLNVRTVQVDTASPEEWDAALGLCVEHLVL